jgi:DNA repair exonuclease SbcCD ATPase subunit
VKLLRLKADGFGALRGEFHFEPSRVSIVVDDNERGKSTLLAAVTAGLYGLDGDRRSHRPLTPLERWRPWDGGSYRVELELEHGGGERYTVSRDFDRDTVAVWNARGEDVTAEFHEGRDGVPVGKRLLDLDADEFERCALVRQGELLQVVPGDERERRGFTLKDRLEAAADSRVGDVGATEALRVLEAAQRRYNCPELDFTGTVENAIQRLESKEALLETELRALEHDRAALAAPLEELAELGQAEQEARAAQARLEAEWREAQAADARRQLLEDRARRQELEALRREAESLAAAAALPAEAESQLRDVVARIEEAQRNVSALESRRQEEVARERAALETERQGLAAFEAGGDLEADRCVSLAAELRRVAEEDQRLRDEIFNLRESLASQGHDPERLQWLVNRLGRLTEADHALLRRQSELALARGTEVAVLESQRTAGTEALREIDAQRSRWSLPGWFLLALGIACLVAGTAVVGLQGLPVLSWTFFATGSLLLGSGLALLRYGRELRAAEREEALRKLSESQRRMNQLRQQRAETESGLEALARELGYRDLVELLREWNELVRLREESAPTLRAQQQHAALDQRRQQATEEAQALLERFGLKTPTPESLERVAGFLRRLAAIRQRLAALDERRPWLDEQRRVDEATSAGHKERALRILRDAGMTYDPERSWGDHVAELAGRLKGRQRHATLTEELIPLAERRLLSEAQIAELEGQAALGEARDAPESGETPRRGAVEFNAERRRLQEGLEEIQRRRSDLRVKVEEGWRRLAVERPERLAHLERIQRALLRARRFREGGELACATIREVAAATHQRWADFLNGRVAELLAAMASSIEQVRVGDDLDFSLRAGGVQLPRGKADQQLSAGARDQLYLAVRIAVSEFLSRGRGALPLLFDDVFATSDDERARAGMRLLIEALSAHHQIILVTCHRQRHEAFAAADRELYDARVRWQDTRSLGLARGAAL